MLGPLVGIIVLPLANHSRNIVPIVNVFLIPINPRGAAKDHVWVDIPVLQALNPVDAPIVLAQCFVDVASLVVIVVHVRIEFAQPVSCRPSEEPFENVPAHVVQIISVIIEN